MKVFRNKKLFFKIYFWIISLTILLLSIFAYYALKVQQENILDSIRINAKSVAKLIEIQNSAAILNNDNAVVIENNIRILTNFSDIFYIVHVKDNGIITITEKDSWKTISNLPVALKKMQSNQIQSQLIKHPFFADKDPVYHYVYPLIFNNTTWGWIHIGINLKHYDEKKHLLYQQIFILFILFFITLSVVIYLGTKQIVQPIHKLILETKKMAQGDFDTHIEQNSEDDVGQLTKSFNDLGSSLKHMKQELVTQNKNLEHTVKLRTKELVDINAQLEERIQKETNNRLEQELILIHQSRRAAMGEMIGNIAHQWRQPLNSLSLLIQNIKFYFMTDQLNKEYMERMNTIANSLISVMSQTIDDFRDFFSPHKEKESFVIAQEISNIIGMLSGSFKDKAIALTTKMNSEINVFGYSNQFAQVVLNILSNAQDALLENRIHNRCISIELLEENNNVVLNILDNAGGIDSEIIDKIFDPYFSTKTKDKGTGIGLYMSKIIIESNMGGKIDVKNYNDGALFTIIFPCSHE